ncbi:MAG: GGDEF domain-containing protein, partial [Nocardioidaceae bacterium]
MRNQDETPSSLAPDLIDAIWSMRSLGIVIYRATGRILDANDRFARLLGYTVHELRQLNVDEVVHPDVRRRYDAPFVDPVGVEARRTRIEPKLLHRNGHPIWVRIHKSSIVIDGERCVLVCIDDWTTHHERLTAIEYDADHDRLTGVQNRRGMLRTVERHLLGGPQTALAVELGGVREINDLRGYAVGDIVLREVATVLASAAGDDARVARLYGAEFIVLTDPGD